MDLDISEPRVGSVVLEGDGAIVFGLCREQVVNGRAGASPLCDVLRDLL
jgi:hypothetical protein